MKKFVGLIFILLLLAGCNVGRGAGYNQADDTILCNPDTKHAFHVRRGPGDTSFVQRVPSGDKVCV